MGVDDSNQVMNNYITDFFYFEAFWCQY